MSQFAQYYWDLEIYREAFDFQQTVFRISQAWPKTEAYSLTDQMRRSSRSVGANIAEAWAKRRYPAHFVSKLTDCDGELLETRHWLRTADACGYLDGEVGAKMHTDLTQMGKRLGSMIMHPDRFQL